MFGGSGIGTTGFAEVYAMRSIHREKVKKKLASIKQRKKEENVVTEDDKTTWKLFKSNKNPKNKNNPKVSSADS
ncbi:PREDICTED: uncharacterized protein LOC109116987 [Tarenaya hassleriana]|uniref:uncharacterized protein LOC109116987 n=1 Tax=Tarenaya hassleriana TaxID=28532 RepID=UPI0008FD3F94|nr:PREDICTED: uncharacterized protein LOC109116987 [Tarenaya hassleriana]